MPNNSKSFVVRGEVRQEDGSPVASLMVKAFEMDLRGEEVVGETTTDEHDSYQLTYPAEQFNHEDNDCGDLIIHMSDSEGNGRNASEGHYNAPVETTIDLVVELHPILKWRLSPFQAMGRKHMNVMK